MCVWSGTSESLHYCSQLHTNVSWSRTPTSTIIIFSFPYVSRTSEKHSKETSLSKSSGKSGSRHSNSLVPCLWISQDLQKHLRWRDSRQKSKFAKLSILKTCRGFCQRLCQWTQDPNWTNIIDIIIVRVSSSIIY